MRWKPPQPCPGPQEADTRQLTRLFPGLTGLGVLTRILFTAVVTTTTSTTVVHAPYPQPPSVPPSYPGPSYQGYHPMPPQPGLAAAPYPTQYPPPYPAQPMGPPAYHETLSGEYHCQLGLCLTPKTLLYPQPTGVLSIFRRCSHALLCQPASLQPSLYGPPEGRPLRTALHLWLPLDALCVDVRVNGDVGTVFLPCRMCVFPVCT